MSSEMVFNWESSNYSLITAGITHVSRQYHANGNKETKAIFQNMHKNTLWKHSYCLLREMLGHLLGLLFFKSNDESKKKNKPNLVRSACSNEAKGAVQPLEVISRAF